MGLLATALLLWGIVALARRPRARGLRWAALAPCLIFVLIQNKNLRYTLPLLPAAALVAGAGVSALPPRARRGLGWACAIVGVAQVGSAAFALPPPTLLAPTVSSVAFSWPPDGRDWHHREILDAILRAAGPGGARVAVVPNDNFLSVSNFRYEVTRDRLPLRLSRAWEQAPLGVDFAIVKTGDQGLDAASAKPDRIMAALEGGDPWLAAAYPVIARVPLPDGSEGMVRMRHLEPVRGVAPAELAMRLRRGVAGLRATMDEGWIQARWARPGPGLSARLALAAGSPLAPFTLRAADLRYAGVRLPGFLVDWIVRNFDPTPRLRRLPMPVSMAPIRIQRARLEVGEDPAPTAATPAAATKTPAAATKTPAAATKTKESR